VVVLLAPRSPSRGEESRWTNREVVVSAAGLVGAGRASRWCNHFAHRPTAPPSGGSASGIFCGFQADIA
jgi:hypothetical protein